MHMTAWLLLAVSQLTAYLPTPILQHRHRLVVHTIEEILIALCIRGIWDSQWTQTLHLTMTGTLNSHTF